MPVLTEPLQPYNNKIGIDEFMDAHATRPITCALHWVVGCVVKIRRVLCIATQMWFCHIEEGSGECNLYTSFFILFIIIMRPFEYLETNSSISSNPNLANLSLYATTTSSIFPFIAIWISLFKPFLFMFIPLPMSSIIRCVGYLFSMYAFCLSRSSFCECDDTLTYVTLIRVLCLSSIIKIYKENR